MPAKNQLGCLLIHGFTSHRSSLEAVIPELDKRHISWHYPILAGHGTKPKDLEKVTWEMWQQDVENGYQYLAAASQKIIVIALSMGTLLAMELAAKHPETVAGLVLLSPCLHFHSKLTRYTPALTKFVKKFPNASVAKFSSILQAKKDLGYLWFPTCAFKHYWLRAQHFDSVLEKIHQPVLIIQPKNDKIASPSGAEHIYKTIPASDKKMVWLEKSGHELLLDIETTTVLNHIFSFKQLQ
jgi:carboxylesterase